jgi:amino acid transporter
MLFYVSVTAGMAMGTSSFLVLAGLLEIVSVPFAIAAILGAAIFCVVIASAVAEMATMFPAAPGVRTYLRAAFGDRGSLFFVFIYLVFVVLVAAAESCMFARVVSGALPGLPPLAASLGMITIVVVVNCLGLQPSRRAQVATTCLLALATLAVSVSGLLGSPQAALAAPAAAHRDSVQAFPGALGMCVFLFIGFEWVTSMGLRPAAYARKIPWSMPLGIGLNALLYVVFIWGATSLLSLDTLAATPIPHTVVAEQALGRWGVGLALALSVGATFSTFNAGVMGGARLVYVLAREHRLPAPLARFSVSAGVPLGGVLLLGVLAAISTVTVQLLDVQLLVAIVGSSLVCAVYAAMLLATHRLRATPAAARRGFRSPLGRIGLTGFAVTVGGIGLASLAAQSELTVAAVSFAAVSCIAGLAFARWSAQRGAVAETLVRLGRAA